MGFKKQNILNFYLYDTPVDNVFITEYMPTAPEMYVKTYLLGLMHAQIGQNIDNEDIAGALGISEDAVREAWNYWEEAGLVQKVQANPRDKYSYDIEFVNIRERAFGGCQIELGTEESPLDNKAIAELYRNIEVVCGRTLSGRELEEVAVWISEFNIKPEVVVYCYRYCVERNKSTSCSYVGAILRDWKEKGLTKVEDVEAHIFECDGLSLMQKRVFTELGFKRNATKEEQRIIQSWISEYGFCIDDVVEACKKTSGITSPSINYVNSVLLSGRKEKAAQNKETLIAKVQKQYETEREENKAKAEAVRQKVFSEVPRIKEIMSELREAGYSLSSALLKGVNGQNSLRKAKEEIARLNEEKASLLEKHGYAPDALDEKYNCYLCKDTGLLENGTRCSCFDEKLKKLMAEE